MELIPGYQNSVTSLFKKYYYVFIQILDKNIEKKRIKHAIISHTVDNFLTELHQTLNQDSSMLGWMAFTEENMKAGRSV